MFARIPLCVAAVLIAAPLLASADEAAPEAAETPVEVAQRYAELIRVGEAGAALDQTWDLDVAIERIFGEHLEQHNASERKELKRLLRDSMQRIMGDPRFMKGRRDGVFEGFRAKVTPGEPNTAVVNYTLVYPNKQRILHSVSLRQSGDEWRIVDAGSRGQMLVTGLNGAYAKVAAKGTPLQWLRMQAGTVQVR
jgi:hypothetical protein